LEGFAPFKACSGLIDPTFLVISGSCKLLLLILLNNNRIAKPKSELLIEIKKCIAV
jgi:hypothetical protein